MQVVEPKNNKRARAGATITRHFRAELVLLCALNHIVLVYLFILRHIGASLQKFPSYRLSSINFWCWFRNVCQGVNEMQTTVSAFEDPNAQSKYLSGTTFSIGWRYFYDYFRVRRIIVSFLFDYELCGDEWERIRWIIYLCSGLAATQCIKQISGRCRKSRFKV